MIWTSTTELAYVSGLTVQQIRNICKTGRGFGCSLDVRTIEGKGGKSGLQYMVRVASLPEEFQSRLQELNVDPDAWSRLRTTEQGSEEHNWKLGIIRPIIAIKRRSPEREMLICEMDGQKVENWRGKPITLKYQTIRYWVRTYEKANGMHLCLASKVRSDKGQAKVTISRKWSAAVPFDEAVRQTIHDDLKCYIRSLLKNGAQRKQSLLLTSVKLREISAAYGFELADGPKADAIFKIPLNFYRDEAHYKAVARDKFDKKASHDDKPRIQRTIFGMVPMEVVVMDVHHINILVEREDGTTATPKMFAFHDIATGRVFAEIIFFEKRGGVRNIDVITAFVNMCQHPAFGLPQRLYVDNGSEYRFADHLQDALSLNATQIYTKDGGLLDDQSRITRAIAYNASAKQVENFFGQFNRQHARHIKGWIDDDRMNPKSPELGKLPAPFDAGFSAFCDEFFAHLQAYEHIPQGGELNGNSPAQVFKSFVSSGWKANVLNPDMLHTVFTKPEKRVVCQHGIDLKGQRWTCDGLLEFFGSQVLVHVPQYHGFQEVRGKRPVILGCGYFWAISATFQGSNSSILLIG